MPTMRFLIFLAGFFGSVAMGVFGWFWLDYGNNRAIEQIAYGQGLDIALLMPDYGDFDATARAAVFLIAGGLLGLLGSLLTLLRRGVQGAVLLILAIVGPTFFKPPVVSYADAEAGLGTVSLQLFIDNPGILMFAVLLGLLAFLSLFIRRLPASVPVPAK
jgi:hypothetical protein